ncbi:NADH-quinone oxidoreductase subunit I [bacterium]|nr:MAG: NADH-quinone oxidoreductase subunit I [bacterium]
MRKILDYTISLLKGLGVTAKYLFRPSVTLQYPKQRWTPPERFRGRVALRPKKCISCQMCARACPNNCLEVKFNVGEDKKRKLNEFIYRMDTCLFCGLCVEPCPASAIFMNHDYELSVYDRNTLIMNLVKTDSYVE